MSAFEYDSVMVTVVLALAVARLLTFLATVIANPGRVQAYWLHLLWVVLLFVVNLQAWVILWSRHGQLGSPIGQILMMRRSTRARARASTRRACGPPRPRPPSQDPALRDAVRTLVVPPRRWTRFPGQRAFRSQHRRSGRDVRPIALRLADREPAVARSRCDPRERTCFRKLGASARRSRVGSPLQLTPRLWAQSIRGTVWRRFRPCATGQRGVAQLSAWPVRRHAMPTTSQ